MIKRIIKNKRMFFYILYVIVLAGTNLCRIKYDNFWADEAYTGIMSLKSVAGIVRNTAADVHPPLYYIIVRFFVQIFGVHPWVYRFVSVLPYLVILIYFGKVVVDRWGYMSAYIFISIISITEQPLLYNTQVRMYSWTACLLLLTLYRAIVALENDTIINYAMLVIFGLCTAYTHYYGLIPIVIMYFSLLVYCIYKHRDVKKMLVCMTISLILYIPWLMVLLYTMRRLSSDGYWIETIPSLRECVKYMIPLQNKYLQILFIILMLMALFLFMKKTKHDETTSVLLIFGVIMTIGTIVIGEMVSLFILPVFIDRYMYPAAIIIWLLCSIILGYCTKKDDKKTLLVPLAALTLIMIGSVSNIDTLIKEKADNETFCHTKEYIDENISNGSIITDDNTAIFMWYYPDKTCMLLDEYSENMVGDCIISVLRDTSEEELCDRVPGYLVEDHYHNGMFGTHDVEIYKLKKKE